MNRMTGSVLFALIAMLSAPHGWAQESAPPPVEAAKPAPKPAASDAGGSEALPWLTPAEGAAPAASAPGAPAAATAAKPVAKMASKTPVKCEEQVEDACRAAPNCAWVAHIAQADGSVSPARCAERKIPAADKKKPVTASKPKPKPETKPDAKPADEAQKSAAPAKPVAAAKPEADAPAPVKPQPVKVEPATPPPAKPEQAKAEPVKPQPVKPEAAKPAVAAETKNAIRPAAAPEKPVERATASPEPALPVTAPALPDTNDVVVTTIPTAPKAKETVVAPAQAVVTVPPTNTPAAATQKTSPATQP
jgi:hypothetical protein